MADPWSAMAQSTANLPALGMGMIGLRERNADRDEARALMQARADETMELKRQQLAATQGTAEQAAWDREAKLPFHQQRAKLSEVAIPIAATEAKWGKAGVDAISPMTDLMQDFIKKNPSMTKADMHSALKSAFPSLKEDMMDKAMKHLQSGKLSPVEQKRMAAFVDSLTDDDGSRFIDQGVMSNTFRSIKMEEENTKAKLAAAKADQPNIKTVGHDIVDVSDPSKPKVIHRAPWAPKEGGGEGGTKDTALQKNAKWMMETFKIPAEDALAILSEGKTKSKNSFKLDIYKAALSQNGGDVNSAKAAMEEAGKAYDDLYGKGKQPAPSGSYRGKINKEGEWHYEGGKLVKK